MVKCIDKSLNEKRVFQGELLFFKFKISLYYYLVNFKLLRVYFSKKKIQNKL